MNRRQKLLEIIRVAGYENDQKTAIRIYVENRISYQAFREAFQRGHEQRQAIARKGES